MSEPRTPRLPSSYPQTPAPVPRTQNRDARSPQLNGLRPAPLRRPRQPNSSTKDSLSAPYIPLDVVDAPTQRFYVLSAFVVLQGMKLYDLASLWTGDDGDSMSELWFCFKWVILDTAFLGLLPHLRIPWLDYSQTTTMIQILVMALLDIIVALKIYPPFGPLVASLWKTIYDRELSLSEKSVKLYDIVHNSSHIQGKYTVHILPEGTAMLNPYGQCYCLDETNPAHNVPLRINGTEPVSIQVVRRDLDTGELHFIDIKEKETKKLFKQAKRDEDPSLRYLNFVVKQPGLYRLSKVKDVSMLDVRITRSDTLVVPCPRATIQVNDARRKDKCSGELSDLTVLVEGLAPLSMSYSRIMKHKPTLRELASIQPENFGSPLMNGYTRGQLLDTEKEEFLDFAWAKRQKIPVSLNESLSSPGDWVYIIDKVVDACGNNIYYTSKNEDGEVVEPKSKALAHTFAVHARPQASFAKCDPLHPMSLPPGRKTNMEFRLDFQKDDAPYSLQYTYMPPESGDKSAAVAEPALKDVQLKSPKAALTITAPGLYSLKSISNKYCTGDIIEPASCLVITPPKPNLTLTSQHLTDPCTGSSIGLTIDLTLVGTPNFVLYYRLYHDDKDVQIKTLTIDKTRYQATFKPNVAGRYVYEFYQLDDKWNDGLMLEGPNMRVEQVVKPQANASFLEPSVSLKPTKSCIDEPVEFQIALQGVAPWKLVYDLIHSGKKTSYSDGPINHPIHTIRTPPLTQGGTYTLALSTVEDVSGCKVFLETEAKIDVRYDKPRAGFAAFEGKMHIRALEGRQVQIPLRMSGEKPWQVRARNLNRLADSPIIQNIDNVNGVLKVKRPGTYELMDVKDLVGCPGSVSPSTFEVSWIERPTIRISETASIKNIDGLFVRKEVCEGDEDSVEVGFTGSAPYVFNYIPMVKGDGMNNFMKGKPQEHTAGLGVATVRMDTSVPGLHRYEFISIADSLYDNPKETKLKEPLVLEQNVHPKPTVRFAEPGKTYKYCRDAGAGDDTILMHLSGLPPFQLAINIKHHSTGKDEIINIPTIDTNVFAWKVAPQYLTLGTHSVSILKVKDARNCVRKIPPQEAPIVYIGVANLPTITPEDPKMDFCVGDKIVYSLQGSPPFQVEYVFEGVGRKAASGARFSRVAHSAGNFTITGLLDSASDCKVALSETKIIHDIPSVRISEGMKGIHEGDQAEIHFQFFGTPPFTFTYARSEVTRKGGKPRVMEMHSKTTNDYTYSMYASQEGTYEVISIEDRYCSYSKGKK